MARRMEIELTSSRDDGTWTWRAAGAREPRGVVAASMLSGSPRVGDVLRVEAEFELDGITILSVVPSKSRSPEPERIELLRPAPGSLEPVTTSLVARSERRGRDRRDGGERREGRPQRPRREGGEGRSGSGTRAGRREVSAEPGASAARSQRPSPQAGDRAQSSRPPRADRPDRPIRTRPARLTVGTKHRDELLAGLPPEQRPIAEQLAQGGLPAVRRAISEEQAAARAAGRPALNGDAIVALAEQLQPGVREAVWLDRAEAAAASLETISLRDLRATVVGAAPRDEASRALHASLREALNSRLTKLRENWEQEIAHALDEGRVLQALRLSARPPEPTTRFPAALVQRLATAAGEGMSADVPAERWLALLEAASASPIRRSIRPTGLPEDKDGALRQAATEAAGRVPALARLLGLAMPPPPRPVAQRRPVRPGAPVPPPPAPPASGEPAQARELVEEPASSAIDEAVENAVALEPVEEPRGEAATGEVVTSDEGDGSGVAAGE